MANEIETAKIIKNIGSTPDKLIEILIEVQNKSDEHYISEEQINEISNALDIPPSRVYGTASFYAMLSTKKRARYVIQICNNGPCYIENTEKIVKMFEDILHIKIGGVTEDKLFTIEYISCFGACDRAPAVMINDEIYGGLTSEKIEHIIDSLRREAL